MLTEPFDIIYEISLSWDENLSIVSIIIVKIMLAKGKIPPESKPKLSKKAQKAAKQEEKNKESQSKPEKKEFTELSGILSKKRIEFMG